MVLLIQIAFIESPEEKPAFSAEFAGFSIGVLSSQIVKTVVTATSATRQARERVRVRALATPAARRSAS